MPVYRLSDDLLFPRPDLADEDGLIAVGGDLSEERLLLAYSLGIFPWYSEPYPILWWSPEPRLVLVPSELKVSRSLTQAMKKDLFKVTMDIAFEEVITHCSAVPRKGEEGTWITAEMNAAYTALHYSGFAHSIESWHDGKLAGGLYGVSLGGIFFGESMFTKIPNASKVAFVRLVRHLIQWGFSLVDCQVTTKHLVSLGAREVPRKEFQIMLNRALRMPTRRGKWRFDE